MEYLDMFIYNNGHIRKINNKNTKSIDFRTKKRSTFASSKRIILLPLFVFPSNLP